MTRGGARKGSGRKPTLFDHKRAIVLKSQGLSNQKIAARFGISEYAIAWFFRKLNEKTSSSKDQRDSEKSTRGSDGQPTQTSSD